jgi:hypothetical protein
MDAVLHQWYATVLAAIATSIGMGRLHEKDAKCCSGSAQRHAARVETAKAATAAPAALPTATSTKTTVCNTTRGIADPAQNPQPSGTVPAATAAQQANGHKTEKNQVMQLAQTLKKQNRLIILLFSLFLISNFLPLTLAFDNPDQIVMFNQVGQMASSMAYIHAAIPLNISTYQNHLSLFATTLNKITSTPSTTNTPVIKSIKDMALFATKQLNKLATKLCTIENVLPSDDV